MPFPFSSSLVFKTKMSQSFLEQKSSLFISRETNQENLARKPKQIIEDKRGSEVLSFCMCQILSVSPSK